MKLFTALILVVAAAASAEAQEGRVRSSSQQIGRYTYVDHDTPYGRITATYETIGRFTYGTYSDGGRSASQQIGRFTYSDYVPPALPRYPYPVYRLRRP